MKRISYYSRINELYPSQMGADSFGLYRNLANESNIGYSINNKKFEILSKNASSGGSFFGKRK